VQPGLNHPSTVQCNQHSLRTATHRSPTPVREESRIFSFQCRLVRLQYHSDDHPIPIRGADLHSCGGCTRRNHSWLCSRILLEQLPISLKLQVRLGVWHCGPLSFEHSGWLQTSAADASSSNPEEKSEGEWARAQAGPAALAIAANPGVARRAMSAA